MSFNHSFPNDQQGHFNEHDHVHNHHAAAHYPQLDDRSLTCYTFLDFVTPNHNATIPIMGARKALESLDYALSPDVFARRAPESRPFSAYTPLAIALNTICAKVELDPITERDLAQLHRAPWFADFAKAVVKRYDAEGKVKLNLDNLAVDACLSEDHMVLLAEAFAASHNLSTIELGIVAITKKGVKAFHYPWTAACNGLTAWIVADCRTDDPVYYGLGREIVGQHVDEEEEYEEEEEDAEAEEVPTTTPRKTAARVLEQQVPLRAGLSAKDILERHTDHLQYNNILKVGLQYSNQEIAKKVAEDAMGTNKKFSTGASGVVKRINTGVDFIEKEFDIDVGAFRTAYDTARKNNGIPIRGKDGVDDQVLAANASKIKEAMAWVKAGGPRPAAAVAPAPVLAGYAPAPSVSNNNQGPATAHNNGSIPQLDTAMDEPDQDYKYAPEVQSNSFLPQLNESQTDWDPMMNNTLFNFDDFN
ncbi:hypothetical protein E4T50_15435 [Aureobasidium sp. EXF-12298]|nr:hypothetical protein E4T50_15435 [Aureobasidium sp. EXF-12298]KAI4754133.1 hypothetical protein E4T51_12746 [Aureobasidium sp. EXF-12344]KAI4771238.1 hypothetical protein E4T52_13767 [Aureobasidium sp. EXF-3400]